MIERFLEGIIFGSRWLLAAMDRIARSPDEMAEAHVRAQMLLSGEIRPHGHADPAPGAPGGVERRAEDSPMRETARPRAA